MLKIFLLALSLPILSFACRNDSSGEAQSAPAAFNGAQQNQQQMKIYGYKVVNVWPHDPNAFTQGLVFHNGAFIESTGQYGLSSLRRVELQSGRVIQQREVPPQYFAEGMTLLRGKIYQLTWQEHTGFIYDSVTFEKLGEFQYEGEGWGLTNDGESLIMTDKTHQIRFLDPETFKVRRTISVFDRGRPLRELNELEYIKGEIYANVWHQERIARIDPQTGAIKGWIDLTGLLPVAERGGDSDAVLNGIAYDEANDRLFVTGKLWPKLFEIQLTEKR